MPDRSPFVGREREIATLQDSLKRAQEGLGSVVLVSGELGVGKTRLLDEFVRLSTDDDTLALRGRWYESEEMPTYIGFKEALLPLAELQSVRDVIHRSSPYFADIARLGPEFSGALRIKRPRGDGAGAADKYRLSRGVSLLLRAAVTRGPFLIVLDDLHWADPGSLELLQSIGRDVAQMPLLIAGAYRREDVSADHSLHKTIAELSHSRTMTTVDLHGLSRDDVGTLAAGIARSDVAAGFVDVLHRQTDGNPLFIEELVRHVTHSGSPDGRSGTILPSELEVPEGLREVMSRRLQGLSSDCRHLLAVAAVIGREFDLNTVEQASARAREALLAALDEATGASVIRESAPGIYSYAHPLMRSVVYHGMSPSRRITMHLRLSGVLEHQYGPTAESHSREIARHLIAAGGLADPAKVVKYCLQGARQARALFAFDEARGLVNGALRYVDLAPRLEPTVKAELLMELAYAENALGNPSAIQHYKQALAEYEALGDEVGATDACSWLAPCLVECGRPAEALAVTRGALSKAAESRTRPYHSLVAGHVVALILNGSVAEAGPRVEKLVDLAFDGESRSIADHAAGVWHAWGAGEKSEAGACFRRAREALLEGGFEGTAAQVALNHAVSAYLLGRFEEALEALSEAERLAEGTGRAPVLADRHAFKSVMHVHRGEWEAAARERQRWRAAASSLGGATIFGQLALRGEALEAFWKDGPEAARKLLDPAFMLNPPLLAVLSGEAGDVNAAEGMIAFLRRMVPSTGRGLLWLSAALPIASTLASLGNRDAADWYEPLSAYSGAVLDWFAVDIELGRICALMERWGDAERHFEQAEGTCKEQGLTPFLGQLHHSRALGLLARRSPGDRRLAISLLERALASFEDMGLGYLRRKTEAVLARPLRGRPPSVEAMGLTDREVAVLALLAEGRSNHEIAARLFVTDKTVEHHLANIYAKLGVHGRGSAVAFALREGIV